MKLIVFLVVFLSGGFWSMAENFNFERFSPMLASNTPIVWSAASNSLPKSIWIFERKGPRIFSASIISNAVVLGSLQGKPIPRSPTNDFYLWEDKGSNYPGAIPAILAIIPSSATINYEIPNYPDDSGLNVPNDDILIRRTWQWAARFGLAPTQLTQRPVFSCPCISDQPRASTNDERCSKRVFLVRRLNGVEFFSPKDDGDSSEGFWIEFGSQGKIRAFSLIWPDLKRKEQGRPATPGQITACIRRQKVLVLPGPYEDDYFNRIKILSKAKRLTIAKIALRYAEGIFGEMPNDKPPKVIEPFAELEVVADLGPSNMTLRVLAPALAEDAKRMLAK